LGRAAISSSAYRNNDVWPCDLEQAPAASVDSTQEWPLFDMSAHGSLVGLHRWCHGLPFPALLGNEVEAERTGRGMHQGAEMRLLIGANGRVADLEDVLSCVHIGHFELMHRPLLHPLDGRRGREALFLPANIEVDRNCNLTTTMNMDTASLV